jgi:hypothetical protein
MAKKTATKRGPSAMVFRPQTHVQRARTTGVSKKRYEMAVQRAKAAGKRVIAAKTSPMATVVAAAAAGALGYAEKTGMHLPTVMGLEPALLYGVVAAAAGHTVAKSGRVGEALRQTGAGALAVAAYKYGAGGAMRVGEDDDGYQNE